MTLIKLKRTITLLSALLLVHGSALQGADTLSSSRLQPGTGQRLVELVQAGIEVPGRVVDLAIAGYQIWPSLPPADCPFPPSPSLGGIFFTGGQWGQTNCAAGQIVLPHSPAHIDPHGLTRFAAGFQ
jgi:hypothetical protein